MRLQPDGLDSCGSLCATCNWGCSGRLQNGADNVGGQAIGVSLQSCTRGSHVLLKRLLRLANLLLGPRTRLSNGFVAHLLRSLAPCILSFEERRTRFAQFLLIL